MVRGRLQVEWSCSNQTRANGQRDWLNAQLTGRGYTTDDIPRAALKRGVWVTVCNVGFDTVTEGNTVTTLATARQAADPFILAGSWTQVHSCPHDDGLNTCSSTVVRTTK